MNIEEIARLASEAKEYVIGHHECHEGFVASCTPERIAALCRVAKECGNLYQQIQDFCVAEGEADFYTGDAKKALRDLEATP